MVAHDGAVQIGGEGGEVTIRAAARDTKVDMRRADGQPSQLDGAATVTALTTDEPLRIALEDGMQHRRRRQRERGRTGAGDAISTWSPRRATAISRLAHVFGDKKSARVVLRNVRGDIVIGKRK